MASSSLNNREPAPAGFKWILVCNDCKYCFCFDCLCSSIKLSPSCIRILELWIQMYNHLETFGRYFRDSRNLFRGILTGGPNQGQVYISIYSPDLAYPDYCKITQQTKFDGVWWITFECSSFKQYYYFWSGWLYLLYWRYCPRDTEFFQNTSK